MLRNILILIGFIVVAGIVSGVLAYFRTSSLASPKDIETKGLSITRRSTATFYGVFLPILVGVIAFFVFRYLSARNPATAGNTLFIVAIVIAVLFEVMAAIVFKMRGFLEFTILHILYLFSFGWLMPRLLVF